MIFIFVNVMGNTKEWKDAMNLYPAFKSLMFLTFILSGLWCLFVFAYGLMYFNPLI